MTTQLVTLSEYRKNIATYAKQATEKNICFIITSHGKPIGEYKPLKPEDVRITTKYSQDFIDELAEIETEPSSGKFSNIDDLFNSLAK